MTGHRQGHRVRPTRGADGANRARGADRGGDLCVREGLPHGDRPQRLPDSDLKRGSLDVEGQAHGPRLAPYRTRENDRELFE